MSLSKILLRVFETYVVGDPLNEVRRVLVLDVEHLLVNLLHGHASTEHGGDGQVTEHKLEK